MSEAPINPDLPILDDPEAGSTWFISLVSIVLLVVTVLALVVMYFGFEAAEVDRKVVDKPTMALEELRLSQEESLTGYGSYKVEDADGEMVDRIRIPVSRAMELVLADEKARSSNDTDVQGALVNR
ncbi:MAG: hypothetical protein VX012_07020 [Planctomycetota bacterium]|jgi:hypothetical protein|nr:hypothetical protein [Planctomycetota bacterium]